jgi:hypothetical protein
MISVTPVRMSLEDYFLTQLEGEAGTSIQAEAGESARSHVVRSG